MFQKLVNHNQDIKLLVEKGYAVGFDSQCMIIRDIPYLDDQKQLQIGAIVTKLVFTDQEHVTQDDHQILFAGSVPYNTDGTAIPNLAGGPCPFPLSPACSDVVVQRSFSNKPKKAGKFKDFFEKIESYVAIISGPAMALYNVSPYTYRVNMDSVEDKTFKFHDTLTSLAAIGDLTEGFKEDVVAVIGLGGTGVNVLDLIVKTPVKEIRGFDGKKYRIHNAFRSPGRLDAQEFGKSKAEVYQGRYENFRHGLSLHTKYIDPSCAEDLKGVTFAFVCVDKGSSRSGIFDLLISLGIPFIDVGMGIKRKDGSLRGMMRMTYYSVENASKVRDVGLAELSDSPDDLYKTNIQIAELNALNACLAVIRYKQLRGFYFEEVPYYHLLMEIGDLTTVGRADDYEI